MAEWANHPSYQAAMLLQAERKERVFHAYALKFTRRDLDVTEYDRGYMNGYLACLDHLLAMPQQKKAEQIRKQPRKVS